LTLVASASHNTPETDAFIAKFKNPKRVSKGSSLKLLMVSGDVVINLELCTQLLAHIMSFTQTHSISLSLKVAEGAAHIYPRLAPTSEWDTCAAQAIVECAGGKVLQAEGGIACE
jgi:3'(2'), 5'-bisphosphate nucleotidase